MKRSACLIQWNNTPPFHSLFPLVYNEWKNERKRETSGKKEMNGLFLFFCLIHAYIVIKQKEQRTNHLSSSLPVILCCVIWRKKGKCNARFLFFISHTTIPISFSLNWIKTKNACFIHFKQRKMEGKRPNLIWTKPRFHYIPLCFVHFKLALFHPLFSFSFFLSFRYKWRAWAEWKEEKRKEILLLFLPLSSLFIYNGSVKWTKRKKKGNNTRFFTLFLFQFHASPCKLKVNKRNEEEWMKWKERSVLPSLTPFTHPLPSFHFTWLFPPFALSFGFLHLNSRVPCNLNAERKGTKGKNIT